MSVSRITTFDKDKNPNGWIMPFYKQNDPDFADYDVRFIYASAIAPRTRKGPHVHLKRECRLVPILGRIIATVRVNGEYRSVILDSAKPEVLIVKAGTPFCLENEEGTEAIVVNLANHIWMPDDQDNYPVNDWSN